MKKIAAMDQLLSPGREMNTTLGPSLQAYRSILSPRYNFSKLEPYESHFYGKDNRQKLKIYYPKNEPSRIKQILVYFHGHELLFGAESNWTGISEMICNNLGSYFTEHFSFAVIIPDSSLALDFIHHPSGDGHVALLIKWIEQFFSAKGYSKISVFLMGHSFGAVHLSTFLLDSAFPDFTNKHTNLHGSKPSVQVKGIIYLSVPLQIYNPTPRWRQILESDYRGKEAPDMAPNLRLQSSRPQDTDHGFEGLDFLVLSGELDHEIEGSNPGEELLEALRGYKANVLPVILSGHNYISPILSIGTGLEKAEAWGDLVGLFCQKN